MDLVPLPGMDLVVEPDHNYPAVVCLDSNIVKSRPYMPGYFDHNRIRLDCSTRKREKPTS